jgi:DUF1680 family protein
MLRITGWGPDAAFLINGEPLDAEETPETYVALERVWSLGDVVELNLPLHVRMMQAHPKAEEAHNQVAGAAVPSILGALLPGT